MNRSLAFEFLLYGLLLAGVAWFVQRAAPDFGRVTLITGLAGSAFSVVWGVLVLCGYRRRWWMILSLAAVTFTLLSQAITAWMQRTSDHGTAPSRMVAVWITVLLVFSFSLLMNLLHGQGREPEPPASAAASKR